jgi:large subunit ribosomal protein L31e
MAEEIERIYIIPLKKTGFNNSNAAPTAIKRVKNYLTKHMKVEKKDIWIDDSLNNAIWSQGKYKMPSKIRVKAVKFDDGVVEAYLPELEFKKSRRELLKEEREKKEPILRKEEAEEAPEEGAEDYEISPAADGEVKIKKKKAPKEKTDKEKKPKEKVPAKKKEKPKETKGKTKPAKKKTGKKETSKKTASKTKPKKKK